MYLNISLYMPLANGHNPLLLTHYIKINGIG